MHYLIVMKLIVCCGVFFDRCGSLRTIRKTILYKNNCKNLDEYVILIHAPLEKAIFNVDLPEALVVYIFNFMLSEFIFEKIVSVLFAQRASVCVHLVCFIPMFGAFLDYMLFTCSRLCSN